MRSRFVDVTSRLLDDDPAMALVLADISVGDFARAGVTDRHPNAVVNVGIREQLQVGVASGLALEGLRPIVHSYTPFLVERPFEQIKLDLGHQGVGAILVSIGASYAASTEGRTHQAPEDVALLSTLPGWTIHVPGHPDEVEQALEAAAATDEPVYIRLDQAVNRHPTGVVGGLVPLRLGAPGSATVIAVGPMLDRTIRAIHDLDVTLLYAMTVRPFDHETLQRTLTGHEVILVEPYLSGTSAGEVSRALRHTPHRLLSLGVSMIEHRNYGTPEQHDRAHGLDPRSIARSIRGFLHVQ